MAACNAAVNLRECIGFTRPSLAPVIIGEYGISTDGEKVDANADQVLQVAQHSSLVGAAAFTWIGSGADTLTDGQGHLNAYGKQVAQWIASGSQPAASGSALNEIAALDI